MSEAAGPLVLEPACAFDGRAGCSLVLWLVGCGECLGITAAAALRVAPLEDAEPDSQRMRIAVNPSGKICGREQLCCRILRERSAADARE